MERRYQDAEEDVGEAEPPSFIKIRSDSFLIRWVLLPCLWAQR